MYVSFVGVVKFCVCPSLPFGIEGGMLDVIVLIPDHCLSIRLAAVVFVYLLHISCIFFVFTCLLIQVCVCG